MVLALNKEVILNIDLRGRRELNKVLVKVSSLNS